MAYIGKRPQDTFPATNAITTTTIADNAVTSVKIAENNITSREIATDSITTAKIADDGVTLAKMAGLARGKIIYGDASGNPAALALGSSGQALTSDGTDISWGQGGKTTEEIQDIAGAMFSSNTETGITATYEDGDGTIDLVVGTLNQNTTGTAATVTTAAQPAITSVGTLTTLTVDELTINADTITASDDFIIDAVGEIVLDADNGGQIQLKDAGTEFGRLYQDSNRLFIQSIVSDADILIRGNDGGSTITALQLDMSQAGRATFNEGIVAKTSTAGAFGLTLNTTSGDSMKLSVTDTGTSGGADGIMSVSDGDLTLDVAGDIILDADDDQILLKDAGTEYGGFNSSNSHFNIFASIADKDIIFTGSDGGSAITALTLDMSAAGAATFNSTVTGTTFIGALTGNVTGNVTGNASGTAATVTGGTQAAITSAANLVTVGTIGTGVWQGTAIASGYIAADAITGAKIADDAIDSEHYTDGSIDTAHIADDQVTAAKLANTAVTAAAYGSSSAIPVITVDAQGRITAASTAATSSVLTIAADSGSNDTVTVGTDTLTFEGTANEIETTVSNNKINIGLPTNVTIAGNLTVAGTQTTVSSTTITVADPLVSLATSNNAADAVDIGIYGLYDTSGSQDLYSGLFRDASDSGKWKLFKDNQAAPTTTVNTSGTGYATGTLVANLEGNVTGNVTGNTSGTAATVTTAAQPAITSVGTLTTLTVDDITINGSTISDGADLTLDAAGDIILDADGGEIKFQDGGVAIGQISSSNTDMTFYSSVSDRDMIFQGNDGGSAITALTLDMSEAGGAAFNSYIQAAGNISTGADGGRLRAGGSNEIQLYFTGSHGILSSSTGNFTIDVAGNINLDADGGQVALQDGGTDIGYLYNSSSNLILQSAVSDKDIKFNGNDGGSTITALALDMSQAGRATFNEGIVLKSSTAGDFGVNINTAAGDSMKLQVVDTGSSAAAHGTISVSDGNLTLDVAGDIILDADGDEVIFSNAGTEHGRIVMDEAHFKIKAIASDADVFIQGNDGGSGITAVRFDMSNAGAATFNNKITATELDISGNVDVDGTLEADAYTVDGTALNEYIADTVGAMVGSNTETGIAVTYEDGDNTLDFVIGAGAIANSMLADDAVGADELAANSVVSASIVNGSIVGADIAANTITVTNIADDAIESDKIANNAVLTQHIDDNQITGDQLADDLVLSGTGAIRMPDGTTGQRPGSPAAGMFRYNTTLGKFEGYTSAWGEIGGGSSAWSSDTMTGDGSDVTLTLSAAPTSEDDVIVFIDGVFQNQDSYSVSGTTLTFADAPVTGRYVRAYTVRQAVSGTNLTHDAFSGDGSDTTFTLSIAPVHENNTMVFIDGVYQHKTTYSISSTTLTFSTAPPNSTTIECMTMNQLDINVPVDNTITTAKLADNAVTAAKIASGILTDQVAGISSSADATAITIDSSENTTFSGTVTVGVDDSGKDVKFFGATSGAYMLWDESVDDLKLVGAAGLTVAGDIDVDGTTNLDVVDIDGALTQDGGAVFNEDSADVDFRVESNGNANMIFVDGGNDKVGIGTASPYQKLHLQDGHFIIRTNSADADDNNVWFQKSRNATDGSHTVVQDGDDLGSIIWDGSDGNSFESAAKLMAEVDGTPGDGDMPGRLVFMTSADGAASPTERMRIDSAGNVGIGVTPQDTYSQIKSLQLGDTGWIGNRNDSNALYMGQNWYIESSNSANHTYIENDVASLYLQVDANHIWYTAGAGTGTISYNEVMRIHPSGYVKIKDTGNDHYGLVLEADNNDAWIRMGHDGTDGRIHTTYASSAGATPLKLGVHGNQDAITISASGNVGIGTANVPANLSENGFYVYDGGLNTYSVRNNTSGSTYHVYERSAGAWKFYVSYAGVISAVTTNVSGLSDERLKENIKDLDQGLADVLKLKPRKFDWKEGEGSGEKNVSGFIAQEAETAGFEEFAGGFKHDTLSDAKAFAQGGLIPVLTKAIQELSAKNDALEARLKTLEDA